MQSSSGGVGGCRKGLLRRVEETTVGIETDFLHYIDLKSHLEILVEPKGLQDISDLLSSVNTQVSPAPEWNRSWREWLYSSKH